MKTEYLAIQYARGIAALLVVHAHLHGFEVYRAVGLPEYGGFGVDLFFVISGFVMWETGHGQSPASFALKRFARIVPAYWFYTSLLVLVALVTPALAPRVNFDMTALAGSYLFVPYTNSQGQNNPILLQGWTLNFEMYFYLLFALTLFMRSRLLRLGILIACLVLPAHFAPGAEHKNALLSMVASPVLGEFVLGVLLSALSAKWRPGTVVALATAVLGATLLLVAGLFDAPPSTRSMQFGLPAAVFLFGLIGLEPLLRKRPSAALKELGDASYSLYLCHPFVLSATAIAARKSGSADATGLAAFSMGLVFGVAAMGIACAAASLSLRAIERPASLWIRRMVASRKVVANRTPVSANGEIWREPS